LSDGKFIGSKFSGILLAGFVLEMPGKNRGQE